MKIAMSDAWTTADMDVLMCPCAPQAGVPHGFPVWWGYTSLWNLLDLPSIIIPLKDFKISQEKDPKDQNYKPRPNPFDEENWKICTCSGSELGEKAKLLT
jgi:amidase